MALRPFLLASATVVILAASCRHEDPRAATLDAMIASAEAATTPTTAAVVRRSPVERASSSARASWEVEARSGTWADYRAFVEQRLARARFVKRSAGDEEAAFAREETGDVEQVTIRLVSSSSPVRVGVTFTASAW